jgi:hypothetical protein
MEAATCTRLYITLVELEKIELERILQGTYEDNLYTRYYKIVDECFNKLLQYIADQSIAITESTINLIIALNNNFKSLGLIGGIYRRHIPELDKLFNFIRDAISKEMSNDEITLFSKFLTIISTAIARLHTAAIFLNESTRILANVNEGRIELNNLQVTNENITQLQELDTLMLTSETILTKISP